MNTRTYIKSLVVSTMILTGGMSCDNKTVFHQYRAVDTSGWDKRDTLCFDIPPQTDSTSVRITLEVRSTPQVGHQHLWLAVKSQWQQPDSLRTDTIAVQLVEPSGENSGTGISLFEHEQPLYTSPLATGQHGRIAVYHIMQLRRVPGLSDIGIRVERQP